MSDRIDPQDKNPHADYLRQAAEHFGSQQHTPPPLPFPPQARPRSRAQELLDESTRRFGAGTTYGSSGVQPPRPVPATPPPVTPPPTSPPTFQSPVAPPPAAPPPVYPPPRHHPSPSSGPVPPGQVRFDLKPHHAMRVLIGLWIVLALFNLPGVGFWLSALGCGFLEWYLRTNRVEWPADLQDYLVGKDFAVPGAGRTVERTPPIPFRPLGFLELYTGALKVVLRNWPALIGIPFVILAAVVAVASAVGWLAVTAFFRPELVMSDGGDSFIANLILMFVVIVVALYAVAFPADALLLALSVIATNKAVRGEPVRFDEVFRRARQRMFSVLKLTGAFYGISIGADVVLYLVMIVGATVSPVFLVLIPVCFIGLFGIGILLSLAPIVCVVEGLGVMDSFRRSIALCKPAWGRLLGVHLLWVVCATPLLLVGWLLIFNPVLYLVLFAALIAYVRCLQMLIYTDLRMRQENFDRELLEDWTRNVGREGLTGV